MLMQFWAVSHTTADRLALIIPRYRSQIQTARALSSLKQAHRIITTMIMTIISMHMITVMITVTVTAIINNITMAMIRRMLIVMNKTIVIVNPLVTWFNLIGCGSTRYSNTGLL